MKKQNLFFRALCLFFAVQMALPASLLAQLVITGPTFSTASTVNLDLTGAASTNAHVIYPSGNSLIAANPGTKVHQLLAEDFEKNVISGISGPSVVKILESIPGFKLPPNLQGVVTALFPDLVDVVGKQVYEIKPLGTGVAVGVAQLAGYLQLFNLCDPTGGWKAGSTYSPPHEITIDPLNIAIISPPEQGVIIYKLFSVKQFAKRRAVNVAVANNADIEDSVGISTLTGLLGGI